jgi:hypothetical protein
MYRSGRWIHKAPDFDKMSSIEIERHFEREQNRFDKGFMGLDGDYYMYLTQFVIRDRTEGVSMFPKLREVDRDIIFPWMKDVETRKRDGMWVTQRGAGKSTIITGFKPLHVAIKYPGSKTIMTSESVTTTQTNFSEKLKVAYDEMNKYFKPSLVGTWPPENKDKQYVKFGHRDKKGATTGSGSIIQSIETAKDAKSPNKLEGQGAKAVIVDEIFKHPYVDDVVSRGAPLVRRQMTKVGSLYYVGSLSDATAKGLHNAVEMWKNAKTLGIEPLFVDATWFNELIPIYNEDGELTDRYVNCEKKDGTIDRNKAREAILNNRRILEKLPLKKFLREYMMMYPLDVNELFDVATDSWWSDDEVYMFKEQKKVVTDAAARNDFDLVCRPAIIVPDKFGKPSVSHDVKREFAKYFIFEHPRFIDVDCTKPKQYIMGVDTIPGTSEKKDEGSLHAAVVKCVDTNQYVALYLDRDTDMMKIARKTLLLQEFYFDAPALVERNSIGALRLAYEMEGKFKLLAKNPKRFRPKGQKQIETGLNKAANAPEIMQLVRQYVSENIYNIHILQFFNEFMDFAVRNTDMLDAMAMCEALHEDYRRKFLDLSKKEPVSKFVTSYVTDSRGVKRLVSSNNVIQRDGTLDITMLLGGKRK